MNIIDLRNHQFPNNRALFRKEVINLFLNETPGTGKGANTSRYCYIVNSFGGHDVYLSRPAQFNNGFDFTLNVSKINFNSAGGRATTRPTHQNIIDDLIAKKNENAALYNDILAEITNIFYCQRPKTITFRFTQGYPSEIILECIKWLFVEQDVTYWNYSGRQMFYNAILAV